ncbi:MAG: four helix bundle protein [Saprospiraceae bacterium]
MASFTSFEELEAWKSCREVSRWVRGIVKKFPREEWDLKDNILRAARSTTRNIAEGFGRFHFQENIQFCRISRGSLFEIIDDAITAFEDKYITEEEYKMGREKLAHAIKVVNGYIHYLETRKSNPPQNLKNPSAPITQ